MIIAYCKQSCGGKKSHCFGFILLSLNFSGMLDSYLFLMFWTHRSCNLRYKPPDGIRKNKASFPSRLLCKAQWQSCSTSYHENILFLLPFMNHWWPTLLLPEVTQASIIYVGRQHVRKGGGFEEQGVLHSVTTGFCQSLFCCFLEFKSRCFFPFSYWIWV